MYQIIITDEPIGITSNDLVVIHPDIAFIGAILLCIVCGYVGYRVLRFYWTLLFPCA